MFIFLNILLQENPPSCLFPLFIRHSYGMQYHRIMCRMCAATCPRISQLFSSSCLSLSRSKVKILPLRLQLPPVVNLFPASYQPLLYLSALQTVALQTEVKFKHDRNSILSIIHILCCECLHRFGGVFLSIWSRKPQKDPNL